MWRRSRDAARRCCHSLFCSFFLSFFQITLQIFFKKEKKNCKNYSTQYSRVVSHRSTDWAITSLTSEIGRDPVLSGVYGRSYQSII
jgi:hypothetical protein